MTKPIPPSRWCARCRPNIRDLDTAIVADAALYGANAKVSNLINMLPAAKHDMLVLSDSDIAVPPQLAVARSPRALAQPGVGLVTCLYTGEPARTATACGPALAAMGTSYDFLPNVVLGTRWAWPSPAWAPPSRCTRATLDEIGGFAAFADYLADDYEMGRAVRARGHAPGHSRHGRQPHRHRKLGDGTVPP